MKKVLSLLLALLITAPLTACNSDDTPDVSDDKVLEPAAVDHVWKSEYISYPENISGRLTEYTLDGDLLTFTGRHVISEEPYETEQVAITFNLTDRTFNYETIEVNDAYGSAQYTIAYAGGTVQVYSSYNENTGLESYSMIRFDESGAELWNINLNDQFQNVMDQGWFYISNVLVSSETGTIYACTDQNIVALSPDGKRLYEVTVDNYIDNVFSSADGAVYVTFYEWDQTTGEGGTVFKPIDDAKQGFGDALPLPDSVDLQNADVFCAPGYDLFYSNDSGLYAWNFTDPEATLLCSWVNSDLTARDASSLVVLSDTLVLRQDYDPVSGDPQLCVMTPVAPEDVTPKYLIRVAYSENGSNDMQTFAVSFNRESEKYRVVLEDYSSYYADNKASEVLNQEIIAGTAPDVIIDNGYTFDLDTLEKQGAFLDLYAFMDAENAVMTREDFLPCVLKPFEADDGTLPLLVSSFTLNTIFAKTSVVGDRTVWSIDDILALSDTLADDQYLFSMYINTDPEYKTDPPMQLLNKLLPYSLSAFIDEETATCSFDDGRFAALLQFCMECPVLDTNGLENGTAGLFREGKLVLQEETWLREISDYLQTKYYDFGGEDMTVIGYPTADATITSGTAIRAQQKMGITKDSAVADGAWEFLMSTFGDPGEDYYYYMDGFSSAREALDRRFAEEERAYYVFRENGWSGTTLSEGEDERSIQENEWLQQEIAEGGVLGHMTEEDKNELLSILETVSLVAEDDEEIMELIREDVSAYFAGAKTLEDTVSVVQSRVSIYVSEKQG